MKAKTTKFFAMLAVLAVAFAGVAVLVQEQTADAAAGEAVTKATYDEAYTAKVFTSIKLETTDNAKSVVLYKYAEKDANGDVTVPATKIAGGNSYFFAESSEDAVELTPTLSYENPVMFFVLDGVVVKLDSTKLAGVALIQLVAVSDYDATTGVITLAEQRCGNDDATKSTLFDVNGYAYNETTAKRVQELTYKAADVMFEIAAADKGLNIIADLDETKNFVFSDTETANVFSDITLTGEFKTVNMMAEKGMKLTLADFTGEVVYGYSSIAVADFTGQIQSVPEMNTPLGDQAVLKINEYSAGKVTGTKNTGLIMLNDGITLTFAANADVGGAFAYKDEYGDWHAVGGAAGTTPMKSGMNGYKISAGQNMIALDGTVKLEADFDAEKPLTFLGNVVLSGMIYTEKVDGNTTTEFELALKNEQADLKFAGLQIVGEGTVTLLTNALVTADTSFYVEGALAVNGVLKVGEGAVVKAEKNLTMGIPTANAPVGIWNAGQVIVPADSYTGGTLDSKLVRVYMNSTEGTGKFFAGSTEYDGTKTGGVSPLAVAYGAYIDIEGICSVNLTSNNITVKNVLYKYNTMILATKNTTIPLTVSYGNEYSAEIDLQGKDYSAPEIKPKSATFRNVVWETPSVATIYITAPEAYQLQLIKTEKVEADPDAEPAIVGKDATYWADGEIIVKDSEGRVVPIGTDGLVMLIFGEEYTVTGKTETSNYNFKDLSKKLKDLTKDSQIEGSFTMIRNVPVYSAGEDPSEEPVELLVTEGKQDIITVTLKDDTNKIAVGDVILSYTEDGGKTVKDVVKPASGDIKFSIFNNSDVFIKFPSIEYYRFIAAPTTPDTEANLTVEDVTETDEMDGWKYKLVVSEVKTGTDSQTGADIMELATTGKLTVTCQLAEVVEIFYLDYSAATDKDATITVKFSKWYEGSTVHGAEKVITLTDDTTLSDEDTKIKSGSLVMYEGEVYSVTWNDVTDAWENMTYVVADDGQKTAVPYVKGTSATVENHGEIDKDVIGDRTYTLVLDNIEYAKVHNASDKDFNVVSSGITTPIAKATTEDKGAVVTYDSTTTKYSVELNLEVKGKTVMSWTYAVYNSAAENETPFIGPTGVGGPSATITHTESLEGKIIKITNLTATPIPFIVKTQPVEHAQLGDYSRVGNYGDNMFVYVSADDTSFSVKDVRVYYENPDKEGFPDYDRGYWLADPSADGKYWTYTMPAENVVLMPKVTKDYYEVTVVDQTGVQVGDKIQVAPETAAKITLPAKPLMYITEAVPTPAIADFRFDSETAAATFTMPNEDVTITATYAESEYSKDVSVTIGQKGQAINVVLYALDGAEIGAGTITIEVWYTYIDEEGDIMTESVEVPLTYDVENKTAYVISDTTFIQELGENYGGAFAVTGTYTLGSVQGDMVRTAYTPVEA